MLEPSSTHDVLPLRAQVLMTLAALLGLLNVVSSANVSSPPTDGTSRPVSISSCRIFRHATSSDFSTMRSGNCL